MQNPVLCDYGISSGDESVELNSSTKERVESSPNQRDKSKGDPEQLETVKKRHSPRGHSKKHRPSSQKGKRHSSKRRSSKDRKHYSIGEDGKKAAPSSSSSAQQSAGVALLKRVQERKQLWQQDKSNEVPERWKQALSSCGDENRTEKLRKLMGIKNKIEPVHQGSSSSRGQRGSDEVTENLSRQYEIARQSTHTCRGMGLGFN